MSTETFKAGDAAMSRGAALIDGEIVPIAEAKISVLDWGFLRSDATYDVCHVWQGKFFRVGDHIDRFFAGMQKLRMDIGISKAEVKQAMVDCVKATGLKDAYVEIICTRGCPEPGSRDPRTCQNKFWAFAIPFVWVLDPAKKGLSVMISDRLRVPEASVDPTVKNYHWLDLQQGLFDAYDAGAESVLLVDQQGNLCEGPGFNIFVLKGNILSTPQSGVLHGITRRTVMELAERQGFEVQRCDVTPEMATQADELFVTSTAGGPMPLTELNGQPVGVGDSAGEPGPVTEKIIAAYWALHDDPGYAELV
ncbi:aminotransferase class IV [Porticoccaceae bacterium]|nr:aminotransferase class IV [Porticoccaceae bacterium]